MSSNLTIFSQITVTARAIGSPDSRIAGDAELSADVLVERIGAVEGGDFDDGMPVADRLSQSLVSRSESLAMRAPIGVKLHHHNLIPIVHLR